MTNRPRCADPVSQGALLGYVLADLPEAELDAIEDHLFDCEECHRRLLTLDDLRRAVTEAVRSTELGGSVTEAFLERAARDGLSVREYRIAHNGSVACTAGPEDLVLVRLALEEAEPEAAVVGSEGRMALRLAVRFEDLERGETAELPAREVVADRDANEVMLVFPGERVRAYPRSRWTLRLREEPPAESGRFSTDLGSYVMDHSPARDA